MRKFYVTIKAPGIGEVKLPAARTSAAIDDLRTRYEIVDIKPTEEVCLPNDWSVAVGALGRLVQRGSPELAQRAEKALAELLGKQKFLEVDREEAEEQRTTLTGIGVAR